MELDELKAALDGYHTTTAAGLVKLDERFVALDKRTEEIEIYMGRAKFGAGGHSGFGSTAEEAEHKAVTDWLRTGDDAEIKAMSEGDDAGGGYFVPATISTSITSKIFDQSPIRRLSRKETIGTNRFEEPVDKDDLDASWVGETAARTETSTPEVGEHMVPLEEMYAMPKLTQAMIDDPNRNIVAWLEGKVSDKFARTEGTAFTTGNGVAKPMGFLSYSTDTNGDDSRAWEVIFSVVRIRCPLSADYVRTTSNSGRSGRGLGQPLLTRSWHPRPNRECPFSGLCGPSR